MFVWWQTVGKINLLVLYVTQTGSHTPLVNTQIYFVQLGPSPKPKLWTKADTKFSVNHHPSPTTYRKLFAEF